MGKRINNKLRANWSKREKDIIVHYPLGIGTGCDCNYLLSDIFNKEFMEEMKSRGYDLSTLRFSINVDTKHKRFEEKFPTLSKQIKEIEDKGVVGDNYSK